MIFHNFALLVVLVAACPGIALGANNRFRIYPNTTIEIRSITGGLDDALWLAASDGLYRFDGLHFHRIPGYPFDEASHVARTSDGTLWIGSGQGLIKFNGKFQSVLDGPVLGLTANVDELFVRTPGRFCRLRADTAISEIEPKGHFRMATDNSGDLYYLVERDVYRLRKGSMRASRVTVVPEGLRGFDLQVVPGSAGTLWFADGSRAIENKVSPVQLEREAPREGRLDVPTLIRGRGSHVWFLSRFPRRLDPPAEFRSPPDVTSAAPSGSGYEDEWGHFWTDLPGVGLLEAIPDSGWERWGSKYFEGKSVAQTVRDAQGDMIAAVPRSGLWKLTRSGGESDRWDVLSRDRRRYRNILPLPDGTLLASVYTQGIAHLAPDGRQLERLTHPTDPDSDYYGLLRDAEGHLWVGDAVSLFSVAGKSGSFSLRPAQLPGETGRYHAVALALDSAGRPWVGEKSGIARMDTMGGWRYIPTSHRIGYVAAMAFGGDGTGDEIWVAYQDGKRVARLLRTGAVWNVIDCPDDTPIAPAVTVFFNRDSRGWIWRGTKRGVYVSDGRRIATADWLRLDADTGLASGRMNPFGFFEDSDGSVWLSGEDGISHIRPDPSWFGPPRSAPPPRITRIQADTEIDVVTGALPDRFPSGLRTLRIDAGSLRPAPFRAAPFVYRILPTDSEWQPMHGGTLSLSNPRDGRYRLEIGHAGSAPGTSLAYTFRIGTTSAPMSWAWVFVASGGAAVLAASLRRTLVFQRASYRLLKLAHDLRGSRRPMVNPDTSLNQHSLSGEILGGHYLVVRPISCGGFSAVYEARDTRDTNTLAIKVFHRRVNESSWVKDRFAQEVAALRGISHPGVVPVLDSWIRADGRPCLVMPLLAGPTLRDALIDGPMDARRVSRLIRLIGEALKEIHSRGIVHRDLKPENILLVSGSAGDERPVLIDFGNAGLVGSEEGLGRTELLTGSIHYMAPEQLTKHYSAASDIYSFGVIILETLTGNGLSSLSCAVTESQFERELASILAPALHGSDAKEFVTKLAAAYCPDPAKRPPHAAEWAIDLARILSAGDCASS